MSLTDILILALIIIIVVLIVRGSPRRFWRISPPTRLVLLISIVLAVLSVLVNFGILSLPVSAYILMAAAYLALLLGNLFKGL